MGPCKTGVHPALQQGKKMDCFIQETEYLTNVKVQNHVYFFLLIWQSKNEYKSGEIWKWQKHDLDVTIILITFMKMIISKDAPKEKKE